MFAYQEIPQPGVVPGTRRRGGYRVRHTTEVGSIPAKEELYTLYRRNGSSEGFYAKSETAAVRIAKSKLGLVATASETRFRAAGGDYILRNSTGNRIYPTTKH